MVEITADHVKWIRNYHYSSSFNAQELDLFNERKVKDILTFQQTHEKYAKTPLISLAELAAHLRVKDILVKVESVRFGLQAFKVMGGIYAIGKYISKKLGKDIKDLSFAELQSPEVKEQLGEITFISATDGNHGRGVAWAARELGQKSVIYLPKGSTEERLQAIQKDGAHAEITDLNYDDTVHMCSQLAQENDWVMVQDTAWEGYEEIPLWIMQGYASMAFEITEELKAEKKESPTHIILQAGVGSFAAAITAYFMSYYREAPPKFIVVEPRLADCYYQSFAQGTGEIVPVTGHMNSIMAGLCCGIPNNRAFRILNQYAWASFSCDDMLAALGMRVLGNPLGRDPRIVSGESGAIPLGLLYYIRRFADGNISEALQLDESSRVLVINTEGSTDEKSYRDIVWRGKYRS